MSSNYLSILTVVRNREKTIGDTVTSVCKQKYKYIEYIIIDGASLDNTVDTVVSVTHVYNNDCIIVSEPDSGVYDAINKGIRISTSDVLGLLHSDDVFASPMIIKKVMDAFQSDPSVDIVYGDLVIYDSKLQKAIRYWKSGEFREGALLKGWMPPHPTLFVRRSVFENYGLYDTSFRVSADYDFVLRIFKDGALKARYIPEVLVHMRSGGLSSTRYLHIMREDYRAIKKNGIGGIYTLICKYARSASQFIGKHG